MMYLLIYKVSVLFYQYRQNHCHDDDDDDDDDDDYIIIINTTQQYQ